MYEFEAQEKVAIAFHGDIAFWEMPEDRRKLELAKATRAIDAFLAVERGEILECGDIRIDTLEPNKVVLRGIVIELTPKEYNLLVHFMRRKDHWLKSNSILASVWGRQAAYETQYLRVYIGQLRAKIPGYIFTKPNFGYRLSTPRQAAA